MLPRLLLSLSAALLTIGALELLGRAIDIPASRLALTPHTDRGWTLPRSARFSFAGGTITTNSLGLRSPEPDPSASRRVLSLGDSTVFGHGVEDGQTFTAKIGQITGYDAQNAGVPGYTCAQSAHRYRELAPVLKPDVVLVYSMHNDARRLDLADRDWTLSHTRWGLQRVLGVGRILYQQQRGLPRLPVPQFQDCLAGIITAQAAQGGSTVLIVPISDADLFPIPDAERPLIVSYQRAIAAVAERTGTPLVDLTALDWIGSTPRSQLLLDPIHPSAVGHARIGQRLAEVITAAQ